MGIRGRAAVSGMLTKRKKERRGLTWAGKLTLLFPLNTNFFAESEKQDYHIVYATKDNSENR